MNARIEITVNPGENERSAILKPLRAHNFSKAGDPKSESIALLVRDEQTNDCSGLLIPDTDLGENPRRERGV
ncbi:hypothetical protein [Pseudomonas aeruginosa]|uniref:hypothetical protein n=1 Tax=Pseudomonas TaxID=286 RepID=UPI003529C173